MDNKYLDELLNIVADHNKRLQKSKEIMPSYFEPGYMEYLDQYEGGYNESDNVITLKTPIKGLKYDNRSAVVEHLSVGDKLTLYRDKYNEVNKNNILIKTQSGEELGSLSAELCNAIAECYDTAALSVTDIVVSFAEPITKRSRYATQAVVFVSLKINIF